MEAAKGAGSWVRGGARVTGLSREGKNRQVITSRGTLLARDVIVATNGCTPPEPRRFARRLIPVHAYMIATEPLGAETVGKLIRNRRMIVETRWRRCCYRPSPDGERFLFGARASMGRTSLDLAAAVIRKLMAEVFPALRDAAVTHCWTGQLGFARDFLPKVGALDGVHFALACNGSGVGMLPYLCHKAALKVLGSPEGRTAYDQHEFQQIHPFYTGRPWFRPFLSGHYRIKDRFEGSI